MTLENKHSVSGNIVLSFEGLWKRDRALPASKLSRDVQIRNGTIDIRLPLAQCVALHSLGGGLVLGFSMIADSKRYDS